MVGQHYAVTRDLLLRALNKHKLPRSGLRGSQWFAGPPIGSPDFWLLPLAMPDEKPRTLNRMTRYRFVARREVRATCCSANCPRKRKRAEPAATPDLAEAAWAGACTEDSRKLKVDSRYFSSGRPLWLPLLFLAICNLRFSVGRAARGQGSPHAATPPVRPKCCFRRPTMPGGHYGVWT